jgi:hypothetical protein
MGGLLAAQPMIASLREREINQHNADLLHDSDQEGDANDTDDVERHADQPAPSSAEGRVEMMASGWIVLSHSTPRMR